MKKLLATIVVVALCAPAMAATITFSPADVSTDGEATIAWTADAGVIGMGIIVDADADIDSFTVDSFFDIFIDLAFDQGSGYTYGAGAGDDNVNGAKIGEPGTLTLPASDFSISVGGLGGETEPLNAAPLSGVIVLKADDGANVTLSADMVRGAVVGADGAMTVVGLDQSFTIAKKTTVPPCWTWACQPYGDYNGDDAITSLDVQGLLGAWGGKPYDACADFTQDGAITSLDVQALLASWGVGCP